MIKGKFINEDGFIRRIKVKLGTYCSMAIDFEDGFQYYEVVVKLKEENVNFELISLQVFIVKEVIDIANKNANLLLLQVNFRLFLALFTNLIRVMINHFKS